MFLKHETYLCSNLMKVVVFVASFFKIFRNSFENYRISLGGIDVQWYEWYDSLLKKINFPLHFEISCDSPKGFSKATEICDFDPYP